MRSPRLRQHAVSSTSLALGGLSLVLASLNTPACAVRRTTRIQPAEAPQPALEATLQDLVNRVNSWSKAFKTLTASVDFEPTAGSVYSGVIKEYHDVKGFILLRQPAMIRMIGQAPVVRTTIFDMVSDGEEFRLYLVPKQKFIVGKNAFRKPAKNALENMRPQHILEALLIPPINGDREKILREEAEEDGRRYYVVTVLDTDVGNELRLQRKIWFSRSDLEIARLQLYEPQGTYIEDVRYSDYRDFDGVRYPARIEVRRPIEDYRLVITIQKATFNEPLGPDKFELKKPEKAQLVDLTATRQTGNSRGQ